MGGFGLAVNRGGPKLGRCTPTRHGPRHGRGPPYGRSSISRCRRAAPAAAR
jgi:hypothetical protein